VCVLVRERVVHAPKNGRESDFLGGGGEIKGGDSADPRFLDPTNRVHAR